MKLCLACGLLNFEEALDALPGHIISWWMAYDVLDPIGESRADHRIAVLTAHLMSAWSDDARGVDEFLCVPTVADFVDDESEDDDERQTERMRQDLVEQQQFM